MSESNGQGPPIVVDLNRVTRREFRQFRNDLATIQDDDIDGREGVVSEFYVKVIAEWPYGDITPDNYLDLGLLDAQAVDQAVNNAITALTEKN